MDTGGVAGDDHFLIFVSEHKRLTLIINKTKES